MPVEMVSTNIKKIVKFGVKDEGSDSFRYYALEIELVDGRIVKLNEDDMNELKEILGDE